MHKIYRVENADGQGPYRYGPDQQCSITEPFGLSKCGDGKRMPTPVKDNMSFEDAMEFRILYGDIVFGFRSLAQYCNWFNAAERAWLSCMGFKVKVKEVCEVIFGGHQLAFPPKRAKDIEALDPSTLEPIDAGKPDAKT